MKLSPRIKNILLLANVIFLIVAFTRMMNDKSFSNFMMTLAIAALLASTLLSRGTSNSGK